MILSDISVRRPVFATVISLLLIILGIMAFRLLSVREYPDVDAPIVSVETQYRGASAEVVETKITQLLEDRIAGLPGLVKMTSTSRDENSDITLEFSLDRDLDVAANDVRDRLGRIVDDLPEGVTPPEIAKVDAGAQSVMWLTLTSDNMSPLEVTDYAERVLVDQLSTVKGVARVRVAGARRYAMRIWLDREAIAARGLAVADLESALRSENVELPAGRLESAQREFTLRTSTGFNTVDDFRNLVIGRGVDGHLVRLAEVARVELGAENERNLARANGKTAVSLGITQQSKANTVEVSQGVRKRMDEIRPTLPQGTMLGINFDRAAFINESINEVYKALGISLFMVLLVIYLFLGTLRATLIPAVVVPISLLSAFIVMAAFGYSLNVLTLLGLVLAIGLVVDDAIVVLENIYRRIEDGQPPLLAALDGSREIAFAVIATTLVLVAAFVPISYMQGDIGRLFGEFGITVAAAVLFSALVALTLTPMMTSRMFKGPSTRTGFAHWVDTRFRRLQAAYEASLGHVVARPWRLLAGGGLVLLLAVLLFRALPSEYGPQEDRGVVFALIQGPEGASMDYTLRYLDQMEDVLMEYVASGEVMRVLTRVPGSWGGAEVNSARAIVLLSAWDERERNANAIATEMREKLSKLPGVRAFVFSPGGLGSGGGDRPMHAVLGGPDYATLTRWSDALQAYLRNNPGFTDIEADYRERKPTIRVAVDRNRAADLGVSLTAVGRTLETMLGGRIVTTFVRGGEEYNVILQGEAKDRATPNDLRNLYVRSGKSGELIPLSNVITLDEVAGPDELRRFDRLRAITVSAGLAPGYSLGEAIDHINAFAINELPQDIQLNYDGEAREYLESGYALYVTFALALMIVFLVLAAQFESFVHPLVIMTTVPLAITGGLIGLWLFGQSINIFSQIGAILLVGLAAKNGVLIVEFANQLRDRGVEFNQAIIRAAGIRLRPVLMTSLSAAFGATPLALAAGAGSESRHVVGITIFFGVVFATFLTLFIVPAAYALLARNTTSPQHVAKLISKLQSEQNGTVKSSA